MRKVENNIVTQLIHNVELTNVYRVCIIEEVRGNTMKRRELIKQLLEGGFTFERHGANHDVYIRGAEREEIPRHKEINEKLAKAILKRRGLL